MSTALHWILLNWPTQWLHSKFTAELRCRGLRQLQTCHTYIGVNIVLDVSNYKTRKATTTATRLVSHHSDVVARQGHPNNVDFSLQHQSAPTGPQGSPQQPPQQYSAVAFSHGSRWLHSVRHLDCSRMCIVGQHSVCCECPASCYSGAAVMPSRLMWGRVGALYAPWRQRCHTKAKFWRSPSR